MSKGKSASAKQSGNKQKSIREIQIESLERRWGGESKALNPSSVNVGDTIEGIQYTFTETRERPDENKAKWSGQYSGLPIKVDADGPLKVTGIKKGKNFTEFEVEVPRYGGMMTAKKKIKNDVYLRVWKG